MVQHGTFLLRFNLTCHRDLFETDKGQIIQNDWSIANIRTKKNRWLTVGPGDQKLIASLA